MRSLIIDTASSNLYVSVVEGESIKEIHRKGKNHSAVLMKAIKELMPVFNADEIIVGVGPGSYTGVRVGVTTAKVLAWTKNIPLKTISSLYIQASGYVEKRVSLIDARRGNAFSVTIYNDEFLTEEKLRAISEIKEKMIISEEEFKIDVYKVIKKAKQVKNVHIVVPNYLRKTEAERNAN